MANHFKELASRLEAVSTLIRTGCIWKVTENCLEELRLPFRQAHHDFAFCNGVKGLGEAACINHDTRRIADMLRLRSEAFLQECHAGAVELLIPFRHAQRVFGVVMCGPFRSGENGQGRCPAAAAAYQELPVWRPEFRPALEKLVRVSLSGLLHELYTLRPELLSQPVRDARILAVLEFLNARYAERITIRQAAELVYLSPSRLSHLFRQTCGMDFSEYLLALRLGVARELLAGTDLAIGEIAVRCGFGDQNHFSAIFRKRTGRTASEYRRDRPEIIV